MRAALLVALREYAENAKTKGFWIGIFMFPLILALSFTLQEKLDKATPTRHFVLVDQSGRFADAIDEGLERRHQRDVLEAVGEYIKEHTDPDKRPAAAEVDLEEVPADLESMVEQYLDDSPEALEAFMAMGGVDAALARAAPLLRDDAPEFTEPRRRFERVPLPAGVAATDSLEELARGLRPYVRGSDRYPVDGEEIELFAAILIPENADAMIVRPGELPAMPGVERPQVQYWSANLADSALRETIENVINGEVRRTEYLARGLDVDTIQAVQKTRVGITKLNPKKQEGREQVSMADVIRQWAPVGFVYLLWIGIFTISQMLLNNTIEEKSNRIIEVLLSSVTSRELMLGKLAGIAGVGLTMLGAWILSLVGVLVWRAGDEVEWAVQLLDVVRSGGLLPAFLIYFVLGYLMYSGIFLAIGSVCNTLKEAQNLMGPVMIIMIVPLFTMMFIPKDPNGTLATVMSWIPLYTPFVMMNRAAADPPLFDLLGTGILLVVTTATVLWLTGKIFRVGILRTGQPPKLLELLRWLRSA